ncbi:aldehyde dehydrogenase family protein [Tropicibacter alexandrii]|uniref:aldehyde dehydrogenase family protein n=1 Tax=Tropicibacter alexandrii TaxID=2267683 RepID=UPI000EF4F268|nr:aldehyde dehydrogenase family protein [Tropicibacter alexandrii]
MRMYIDGNWTDAIRGEVIPVIDKSTGETLDTVPRGQSEDADHAIQAAQAALPGWRDTAPGVRAGLVRNLAAGMRSGRTELGYTLSSELGRPMEGCLREIDRAADLLDYFADTGEALFRSWAPKPSETAYVVREPVGVVVAIAAFNYPIALITVKLGAALVAGCTVVAKPAEDTPLSTLTLARIAEDAKIPNGVFNVVTGLGGEIGAALVAHPIPAKIAFTGGTEAGKRIAREAVGQMKRMTMELGGQSPAVVCADADLDTAVKAIARHGFANSGQFCYRVGRVLVAEQIAEEFEACLVEETGKLKVGPASDETVDLGPVVGERILATAESHVTDARENGARVLTGGSRLRGGIYDKGCYFPPTLLADCTMRMRVMIEEAFSPVLAIARFRTEAEALELANGTDYGLAAFVFTADSQRAQRLVRGIEAGSVWVNDIQRSRHDMPFGGVKMSGFGREKSTLGIESYLEPKTVYLSA